METYQLYIDGKWTDSVSSEFLDVENPLTHETIARVPRSVEADVNRAVDAAQKAFAQWQSLPISKRAGLMRKFQAGLQQEKDNIVRAISEELGCPPAVTERKHVDPNMTEIAYLTDLAESLAWEEQRGASRIRREPVGIVAAVTPWNYPMQQVTRKIVPALLTGNCVILKPSRSTPMTAYWLTDLIDRAGFPAGVYNMVIGKGREVGNVMAGHPGIDMISFTGSTGGGREVARLGLENIKKITLELGGKSAAILLEGGDWTYGIRTVLDTVMLNSGQSCSALTRLLVPESGLDRVREILLEQVQHYKTGSFEDPDVNMGPLISRKQFDRVKRYIESGLEEGAELLVGEVPEAEDDYFVGPTIFTDVKRGMKIAQEEIFGPVLCVLTFQDVEDAVAIANDSIYGLSGGVFGPAEQAHEVAKRIRTGTILVNSNNREQTVPFGGYRQSGLGRERAVEGLQSFTEIKSIYENRRS